MLKDFIIRPFIGIGGLLLGSDRTLIFENLGEPDKRSTRTFKGDNSRGDSWDYHQIGINLTFSSVDNWLLGTITVESEEAEIEGLRLIGLPENDFLESLKRAGIEVRLEDYFKDLGAKDYSCDRFGLLFWISDNKVTSITLFPKYDASGNNPLWPEQSNR